MNKFVYTFLIVLYSLLSGRTFDPITGELIQDSTKIQLKFDSATGLPIGINKSQS